MQADGAEPGNSSAKVILSSFDPKELSPDRERIGTPSVWTLIKLTVCRHPWVAGDRHPFGRETEKMLELYWRFRI